MELSVLEEDLFCAPSDALLIAIDGAAPGMEGRLARTFSVRFPEADFLEELDSQLDYPIALGKVAHVELEPETSTFSHVIVLSTLDHREGLSHGARLSTIASAFVAGIALAGTLGAHSLRTAVLAGGWRLSQEDAFNAMLNALEGVSHRSSINDIAICCLDNGELLRGLATSRGW